MTDDNDMTGKDIAGLRQQVDTLVERLAAVEGQLAEMQRLADQYRETQKVDEETMMVISATVAAVLGHRAKVKQVQLTPSIGWVRAGRTEVQDHSRTRPVVRPSRITLH